MNFTAPVVTSLLLLLLLQGDGTAAMCANSPGIFTLSVHAASNFPARKQQSSLDVPLPDGLQDEQYLAAVAEVSVRLGAESRTSTRHVTLRSHMAGCMVMDRLQHWLRRHCLGSQLGGQAVVYMIQLLLLLCCDAGASWSTEQLPPPAGAV
jgi:hypothetical protein